MLPPTGTRTFLSLYACLVVGFTKKWSAESVAKAKSIADTPVQPQAAPRLQPGEPNRMLPHHVDECTVPTGIIFPAHR